MRDLFQKTSIIYNFLLQLCNCLFRTITIVQLSISNYSYTIFCEKLIIIYATFYCVAFYKIII